MATETTAEHAIGHVIEVEGGRIVARLLPEFSSDASMVIDDEAQLVGQLGSFVLIRQAGLAVVAQVYAGYARDSEEPGQGAGTLALLPLGELNGKQQFVRGVRGFPTPGAQVLAVGLNTIRQLFSQYSQYRYKVGYLTNQKALSVNLNPSTLFGRHFAVLGQSGSGKSWAVASLIQQAVARMPNAHIIILDLHGEYCWKDEAGQQHAAFPEESMRYLDARALEVPYWLLTFSELVELFVQSTDYAASVQIAFIRECILQLKTIEGKKLGLTSVSVDSPVYFPLVELYQRIKAANEERSDFGKTKGSLFGQFDRLLIRLQSRFNDVRYDFLFKPRKHNNSESMGSLLRDFVGMGSPKRAITVIDLSAVPSDVQPTISAQIGRLAFEFNFWNPRRHEFPLLLVCEEAHAYIPRERDERHDGTRRAMERIAKEGRKYGVGLGLVSQRPNELSETVLSQCSTFICLRITNPDDQSYLRKLAPEGEGDLVDILASLGRGEALVLGEATPIPTRFQVYRPDPAPNSQDVDYFENWSAGPEDVDVDDIVNRWRRQSLQG